MRILVTGGAGFIGSSLCLQLKKTYPGYAITAFDNLKRRGSELNLPDLKEHGIAFVHGDIRNAEDFQGLEPFDVLVEASAEPSVLSGLDSDPTYVINNNLVGSINCFNVCLKHKAQLIFLSTSRVYPISKMESAAFLEEPTRFSYTDTQTEPGISHAGISEAFPLDGARSFYGTTKLSSELFIREYSAFYGLKAAITRFGVIAGPRQMGKTDQGVITLWMARHFWKKSLSYIGYGGMGKQVRDVLHVDDLVALIDYQIHHMGDFSGKTYNAGGGLFSSVSLMELTELCTRITGNRIRIDSDPKNRPADLRIYISDHARLTADHGWKPKHDMEKIMSDIFEWIRSNEGRLKDLLQ